MAENSKIEWTNHSFNAWIGCTKISPACDNCYAENLGRRLGVDWGPGKSRHRTGESYWRQPIKWNKRAAATGVRERVFCASLADVFDNEVPVDWFADLLDLTRRTENLDWLYLSKRIGNFRSRLNKAAKYVYGVLRAQTERAEGLSSGEGRRIGNRLDRPNLASEETNIRPLEWRDEGDAMSSRTSGDSKREGRIPSGSRDDRREASLCGGVSPGLASREEEDSPRTDGQSSEREEAGQQASQSRTSDVQRAAVSRDKVLGSSTSRRSRLTSSEDEARRETSGCDAQAEEARSANKRPRGAVQNIAKRGVANLPANDLEALLKWITDWIDGYPPKNVWLGISVVTQAEVDRDVPKLISVRAAKRFLSMEPLLQSVTLAEQLGMWWNSTMKCWEGLSSSPINQDAWGKKKIDWVIVGGESGKHARPMNAMWPHYLHRECQAAGAAFFFKQGSQKNWPTFKDFASFPADLQVREFP